jgi:hypothetical protein
MKRDGLTLPQRLIKFARDVWMILGIEVAMFVALEAAVSLGFYARGFWHPPATRRRERAGLFSLFNLSCRKRNDKAGSAPGFIVAANVERS